MGIKPKNNTTVVTGYFIGIGKTGGGDGETLDEEYSIIELGKTNGSFGVYYATLSNQYLGRTNASAPRGCATADKIKYLYQIFYPDATTLESVDADNYIIKVYAPWGADVSSWFEIDTPYYYQTKWWVEIKPTPAAKITNGYRITVSKFTNDILYEKESSVPIGNGGLGETNGVFAVDAAQLLIEYNSRSNENIERGSGNKTLYKYKIFYPDGITEETNDIGYIVKVYDVSVNDKSSNFNISTPVYTNGYWQVYIDAKADATAESNYFIGISKTPGNEGDTLNEEKSYVDLSTAGYFNVTIATLTTTFLGLSNPIIQKADGVGTTYHYRVYFKDGVTEETNDTGYIVKVLDSLDNDVTSDFNISGPVYNLTNWEVTIIAKDSATISTGYKLEISKDAGLEGNVMPATRSDTITFEVTGAQLSVSYSNRTNPEISRADGVGTTYYYNVFYPDNLTKETNDTGYQIKVYNKFNVDVSSNFVINAPVFVTNYWKVTIKALSTTPIDVDYRIGISKTSGSEGDTMPEEISTNDLGAVNGVFKVTNAILSITYLSRDKTSIEQADGIGINYTYRIFYPDTVTQETNDVSNYIIKVYNSSDIDVTTNFSINSLNYTNGEWKCNIIALKDTPVGSDYKIGVSKTVNDTLSEEKSSAGDLGANGVFSVSDTTLSIQYISRDKPVVERGSTNGVVYSYNVFYKDNITKLTDDSASFTIRVYDKNEIDVTTNFTSNIPTYISSSNSWQVMIKANFNATVSSNYKISISKNSGVSGDILAEEKSTVDLGTSGEFRVSNSILSISYLSNDKKVIERADGTGVNYFYKVYFSNNSEETNDTGYIVKVYDKATNDVSSQFNIGTPVYTNSKWKVNITAYDFATVTNGYMIGISKTGGDGELQEELSTEDLGVNGTFSVSNTLLSITYLTNTSKQITRADGAGTTYRYKIFYKDGVTEETNDFGYTLKIFNYNGVDVSTNFNIGTFIYTGTYWEINIQATIKVTISTGYYVELSKVAGGEGDTMLPENSKVDLGSAGTFDITSALLSIHYSNRSPSKIYRSDTTGVTYYYSVYYPDNITTETMQSGYSVKVYNSSMVDVSTQFTIFPVKYTNSLWQVTITGKSNTVPGTNFRIGILKTNEDYFPEEYSTVMGTNGMFDVADLNIVFKTNYPDAFERADGKGTTFKYKIYQNGGSSEKTNGTGYIVKVYDASTNDVSINFKIGVPSYISNYWQVNVQAKDSADLLTGYFIGVLKRPGSDGNVLNEEFSVKDNYTFAVTNATLNITNISRSTSGFEKVDGTGVVYSYKIFYDDRITEETNDTGYNIFVYNSSGNDVTSEFTIIGPTYSAGFWRVRVEAQPNTTVGSNFYIGISKSAGGEGDIMSLQITTNYIGTNAFFDVYDASLSVTYRYRDVSVFNRTNGTGTTYYYNIYFDDGTTEKTDGDGYIVKVYDKNNVDISSRFVIGTPVYVVSNWQVNIQANAEPTLIEPWEDCRIGIEKTAGSDGDWFAEEISTNDLGPVDGTFTVANLQVVFSNRSPIQFERADGVGTTFKYKIKYPDNSEETIDTNAYIIKVYNNADIEVTTNFMVTIMGYISGYWQINVQAYDWTPVANDYYISITKTNNKTNSLLAEEISPIDLGANGRFNVLNATLNIVYSNRSVSKFERADGTGTTYKYRIFYDDGITQETNDTGYVVYVRDNTDTDVSSQFNIGTPFYNNGVWQVNIQSYDSTPVEEGYRIGILKNAGSKGETMAEEISTNDLGIVNGVFEVTNASLNIVYSNRVNPEIEQADDTNVTYYFRIFYDDMVTQETNDTGYNYTVYDASGNNVTSDFIITTNGYSGGLWSISLYSKYNTPVAENYKIGINKTGGGEGDYLIEEISTNDLGIVDGVFEVTNATLNIYYSNRTPGTFERSDGVGVTYYYTVYYDNNITQETDDVSSFSVKVRDAGNNDVSGDFNIDTPVYSGGKWQVNIRATNTTPVGNDYKITIEKSSGTTGDTLSETYSDTVLGSSGRFAVTYATLSITFNSQTVSSFERADGVGDTFYYNIYYPDGSELTNGTHTVRVYNNLLTDVSSEFIIGTPVYSNSEWKVNIQSYDTTTVGTDFTIGIEKSSGDILPLTHSDANLGANGRFDVINATLSITFLSNSTNVIHQADGVGVNYYYQIFYDNNGTQETNDSGYVITVYSNNGTDVTGYFKITNLGYSQNRWVVNIQAKDTTPVGTNYYIGISKNPGGEGDTLVEEDSTVDLGSNGVFDVKNEPNLHIVYLSRDVSAFRRTDGVGVNYYYQVFYNDDVTQETNDTGYVVKVYRITNSVTNELSSEFNIGTPVYSSNRWRVNIQGKTNTTVSTDFFIGISKNPGTENDTLAEEYSFVDLTNEGYFDVTDLRIEYTGRSNSTIERAADIGAVYYFQLYMNETLNKITNATGFDVEVYDSNTNIVTSQFIINGPVYTNNSWKVEINTYKYTTIGNNYFIGISKDYSDNHSLLNKYSTVDLGMTNGSFSVTNATLNIVYNSRTISSFEKGDGVGTTFKYKIFYDNGVTEETNDTGYQIKVYDKNNVDQSSKFIIANYGYISNYWNVNIQAKIVSTADVDYRIGVSKLAGSTGDTMEEEKSTNDLGTDGMFEVRNATLNIVYLSRSNSSFERADGIGTKYFFKVYYDDMVTEEISDESEYIVQVFDATSNKEYTTNFNCTAEYLPGAGRWRATVEALEMAPPLSNYYITIKKINGGSSGAVLGAPPDVPEKSTEDLGATNGIFEVRYATLNFIYNSRDNPTVERGGTNGTTYRYDVAFDDYFVRANYTHENNDVTGYTCVVYNSSGVDVTTNFTITNLSYTYPYWTINIRAKYNAPTGTGFYIGLKKGPGTEGDTAAEEKSIDGDIIPISDAEFEVEPATLNNIFVSRSTNVIYRANNIGVKYKFNVYYDNGVRETNDTGYNIKVYNETNADVTSQFIISTPIFTNGKWLVDIKANNITTAGSNFYISVSKSNGNTGNIMSEKFSTNDLGLTNGVFAVKPEPTLNIVYLSRTPDVIEQGDNGTVFRYQVFYDDGVTQETNDIGYIIRVFDKNTNLVAVSTNLSASQFNILPPVYTNTNWIVRIKAYPSTPTNSGYFISITKSPGAWGDTMNEKYSIADLGADGEFRVIDATLNISYTQRLNPVIEQLDDIGAVYDYNVYYDDMTTELTNEASSFHIHVYNYSNVDCTGDFNIVGPVYTNNNWRVKIFAKEDTPVLTNYYISIDKDPGLSNDPLAEKNSKVDLGNIAGVFEVIPASLNITYKSRTPVNIGKANGSSVIYKYNIYYDNGTEETNDTGYNFYIYDASGVNRNDWFNIISYQYSVSNWEVEISANNQAISTNGYYIGIDKGAGTKGCIMGLEVSTNDLGIPGGTFNITSMTLSISYSNNDNRVIERADGVGTVYYYKIFYPDGSEETNDTGYLAKVYDKNDLDVSSNFDIFSPVYTNGVWMQRIIAKDTATVDTNYYITMEKSGGIKGDILLQISSTNGLGENGRFAVTNTILNVVFLSNDVKSIHRADGIGVNYYYRVYYKDGITQETNDIGYTNYVYNFNNMDISTQFMISVPVYTNGMWKVNIKAYAWTTIGTNYYIGVEKFSGNEGDVLNLEKSTNDLGSNGFFNVLFSTKLNIVYLERDRAVIEQGDNGVTYKYRVFYDDMVTQETNDTGYIFRIYDKSTNEITCSTNTIKSNFIFSPPVYLSNSWRITVKAEPDSTIDTNYFIGISKIPGNKNDTLTNEYSIIDLTNAGYFSVIDATLNLVFSNRMPAVIEPADTGVTYYFKIYYDDFQTELTTDTNSIHIKLYAPNNSVSTSNFNYTLKYTNGIWKANFRAHADTPITNGYYIAVSKTNGNTGDTMNWTNSKDGLGPVNGVFGLTNATLNITYLKFSTNEIYKAQTNIILTNFYQIFYDDGITQETNDTGYQIRILDSANNNRTDWFIISPPVYQNTNWYITVKAKNTVVTNTYFMIGISKSSGTKNITMAEEISTNDLGNSGKFRVIGVQLSNNFVKLSNKNISHSDSEGVFYFYNVYYADGTQETNDTGYIFRVYDEFTNEIACSTNSVQSNFQFSSPKYTNGMWVINIIAKPDAPIGTNYFIGISKEPGGEGDYMTNEYSIVDLGTNGTFNVLPTNLSLDFINFNTNAIVPTGTLTIKFRVLYPDGVTQLTNNIDSSWIKLYNSGGTNITSQFVVTNVRYEIGSWTADIIANPDVIISINNYIGISGINNSDILNEEMSTNDLGNIDGRFKITGGNIILRYLELSKKVLKIGDELKVKFILLYPDGITHITSGMDISRINVINKDNENITKYFTIKNLKYTNNNWEFIVVPNNNVPASRGNYIEISGMIGANNLASESSAAVNQLGNEKGTFIVVLETRHYQNFPNPFDPGKEETTFYFDLLDESKPVEIRIYNLTGNLVRVLNEGDEINNKYEVKWDGRNDAGQIVASGIYYAHILLGDKGEVIKVLVIRW